MLKSSWAFAPNRLPLILGTLIFGLAIGCKSNENQTVIVSKEGKIAPLIIAPDAPPHTVTAVGELQRLIEKISGRKPEIIQSKTLGETLPGTAIFVGPHPELPTLMPDVDFTFTKPEETLIVAQNGYVAILGKDRMAGENQIMAGTANAVYSFLQDDLKVRWLWPGESGEDIIPSPEIAIKQQVTRYAPVFLQRRLFYRLGSEAEKLWTVHQRFGHYSYHAPPGHSFSDWWELYGETHPEYFALQPDGTRNPFPSPRLVKICEGEPGVWRQWLKNVEEKFKADPTIRVFGASQNDSSNSGLCVDPRSKAWDHPDGELQQYAWANKTDTGVAMSDRMVHFANKLGEMLEERFPKEDLQVLVMAYGPSKPAPVEAKPRKNVGISFVGQFPTSSDKWREFEKKQMAGWSKVADFMVFRPNLFYYSGGWHGLPVLTPRPLEEDFRFLAEHNCQGIMVDGVPNHWGPQGLQYYLMAQLIWNPYQPVEPLIEDYCRRGFGPAASKIREFFRLMEKGQMAVLNQPDWFPGMGTTRDPLSEAFLPEAFTPELLTQADQALHEAALLIKDADPIYRTRLELLQRSQQYTRLTMEIILTMNEVRNSQGKNFQAVEQADQLVKAREQFFKEEEAVASQGIRPPAVGAHRIRTTWIESRKLQNWLGPVSPEFRQAAAAAKASGEKVVSNWREKRRSTEAPVVALATPATLRWTGAAQDGLWQNRANWQALARNGDWVPAPMPPENQAKVELGDAAATADPQVIRLNQDVHLENLTISAANPKVSYRIENRVDEDAGIDADSARISRLIITGNPPILQTNRTQADLVIDVPVRFSSPEAKLDLRSEHGASVKILQQEKNTPTASTPEPPPWGNGPVVAFGDSTTALRGKTKVYTELMEEAFSQKNWKTPVINAGVGGNTTAQARKRFDKDVLQHDPALVIIQFGINDAAVDLWRDPPATEPRVALSDYRANLTYFIDTLQQKGATVVLMTPNVMRWRPRHQERYGKPPYDPNDPNGFNVVLEKYAQAVREIAREKNVPLVDVFTAYQKLSGSEQDAMLPDGMHPNTAGHALVAQMLFAEGLMSAK